VRVVGWARAASIAVRGVSADRFACEETTMLWTAAMKPIPRMKTSAQPRIVGVFCLLSQGDLDALSDGMFTCNRHASVGRATQW